MGCSPDLPEMSVCSVLGTPLLELATEHVGWMFLCTLSVVRNVGHLNVYLNLKVSKCGE